MRSTLIFSIYLLMLVSLGFLSSSAKAIEVSDLHFKELTKRNGLSDNSVLDMVEDGHGYIWIATPSGLNRYSGETVKKYSPSDIEQNSIPSGFIQDLFIDSDGELWVGTHAGLAKYLPRTDNFEIFDSNNTAIKTDHITAISESTNGDILFTDRKYLYRFVKETQQVRPVSQIFDEESLIRVIFDEPNRTWLGSRTLGARIIDKETGTVHDLSKVNPYGIFIDSQAILDLKVIDGNYWVGTNNGVNVLAASGKSLGVIDSNKLKTDRRVIGLGITQIEDNVWLATTSGLHIIKGVGSTNFSIENDLDSIHLYSDSYSTTGLPQAITIKVMQDRAGAVWVSTLQQGAFRFHPHYASVFFKPTYKSERQSVDNYAAIWALSENTGGDIFLISQSRGLGFVSDVQKDVEFYETFSTFEKSISFWDLEIDSNDLFWVASSDGLLVFKFENGAPVLINHFFKGEFIDNIHMDSEKVWVWVESKGTFSIDIESDIKKAKPIILEGSSITDRMLPIYTDSNDRLWLRDDKELLIYSTAQEKAVKILGKNENLNSFVHGIFEYGDSYWVTTRSNILRLDKESLTITQRQSRNSQRSGIITSMVGARNSIWYADELGVHQLKLPSMRKETTITNEELKFNSLGEGSVLLASDNSIYFGGNRGFNKVSKSVSDFHTKTSTTLIPQLTEFSVFGSRRQGLINNIDIEGLDVELADVELDSLASTENIQMVNEKRLDYDQSRFSVSFELINAIYPNQVFYRYKLNGFEKEWNYIGLDTSKTAQFNNISFGEYTFEVQAKENGKEWSQSRMLTIRVARPPWLHSVALVFYAILLFAFIGFLVRQYQIRKANQQAIKESEERLKLTLWSSGDELWDWDVYRGQVYRANTWGTLDFPQDDIRTTGAYDANIHPNDLTRVKDSLREHLEGKSDFYELAYRAKTFNNQWIWILDRGKVVERDHNDQPVRMTGTLKNIHHLKEAEEQLNLFKRSIENISEGVFITNTQFKFISVNNAYCGYTGETRDQALASYMHFHLYPDAFTEEIKKTLKSKGNWSGEVESVRVNGERYEMELNIDAVHDDDGKISHFVGVFSDITSRKNTEKELLKLANTDPLTELPNRSFFQASHQNLVRRGAQHTLLCLDMDNFKKINDSLGHQTGDILIKQIAKRLQRTTGKSATCYRLGGDEFSILMDDNADIHTVTHYAQSLLDTLSRPFIINKQEFVLGASIGIAFYPDDGNSPQEMLKNADTAMYFAKNNGGNSYQFFSGEMNQNAVRQLQIENLIRQGIKEDLFTVYYQPKVDIATGKLVSMEALVRFEHPQKGIVSPGQFIPLAEQTGQIIEIGEQVLRKACADTKRWVSQGLFSGRVAVNISAKQFELPDLDDRINRILSDVGLSPLHLECEITEGTLMESPENGLQMMNRLRERGIHLALDDFGTGYSSLAYLKRFPLNTLKIDKAFIDDIAVSSVDRHMAAAIINIAHNLGLKVVAEGVEEEAQLDILRRYDCEMLQGFLYSRPLNAERFEKLLTENQQLHTLLSQSNI